MIFKHHNIQKLNDLILYIDLNLNKKIEINHLSIKFNVSKFHLNRMFKVYTGESIYQYIQRLRIERSYYYLWNEDMPIKIVAAKCGFLSVSNFSSKFKKYFTKTPIQQKLENIGYKSYEDQTIDMSEFKVGVRKSPLMLLAYIKNIGSYHKDLIKCEDKLYKWALNIGVWNEDAKFIRFNHDSMYVTKEVNFRVDICIEVPFGTKGSDGVCIMEYPKSTFAYLKREGKSSLDFIRDSAGDLHYWMTKSGYTNTEQSPSIIIYKNITSDTQDYEFCFSVRPV